MILFYLLVVCLRANKDNVQCGMEGSCLLEVVHLYFSKGD